MLINPMSLCTFNSNTDNSEIFKAVLKTKLDAVYDSNDDKALGWLFARAKEGNKQVKEELFILVATPRNTNIYDKTVVFLTANCPNDQRTLEAAAETVVNSKEPKTIDSSLDWLCARAKINGQAKERVFNLAETSREPNVHRKMLAFLMANFGNDRRTIKLAAGEVADLTGDGARRLTCMQWLLAHHKKDGYTMVAVKAVLEMAAKEDPVRSYLLNRF
jgi:hypothetical protein